MSFRRTFFKNILISGGYTYLSQTINFAANIIASRILLPSEFGLVNLITIFSGFISVFSDSGITLAVIRSPYKNTFYKGLNVVSVYTGIILCIITLLLLYPVSLFYNNSEIIKPGIFISALFILRAFYIVPMAILQKNLQFSVWGKITLVATIASVVSMNIMAFLGFSYWSLIWAQFVNAACIIVFVYAIKVNSFSHVKKSVVLKSFAIAKGLIGNLIGFNSINYWARNSDNLLVGKYYGIADLGIYNRAYQMLQLPLNLITGLFNSVLFPSMVRFKNEGGDVEKEYYFILKILSLINLPIALILIIFPEQFVHILWGSNWLGVAKLLPYFGVLVMLQTLFSTVGNLLVLEHKEKVLMISGWVSAFFLIGGIVYGATISLTSIAAFFALAYIGLVLPFVIIYNFKMVLGYSGILKYLLPKVILSLIMWLGIYTGQFYIVIITFIAWVALLIFDLRNEATKFSFVLPYLKRILRF